jgi:uncharacterized membrane protein YkvI
MNKRNANIVYIIAALLLAIVLWPSIIPTSIIWIYALYKKENPPINITWAMLIISTILWGVFFWPIGVIILVTTIGLAIKLKTKTSPRQ